MRRLKGTSGGIITKATLRIQIRMVSGVVKIALEMKVKRTESGGKQKDAEVEKNHEYLLKVERETALIESPLTPLLSPRCLSSRME
jgi:hypothetical protein